MHRGKVGPPLTDLVAPGDEPCTWILTIPFLIPPPENSIYACFLISAKPKWSLVPYNKSRLY